MSYHVDTVTLPPGPEPDGDGPRPELSDDPPFLQEPTFPVADNPPVAIADRMADLAYRRRAAAVVLLTSLVVATFVLAYRSPLEGEEGAGSLPSADRSAMIDSAASALRSVAAAPPVPASPTTTMPTPASSEPVTAPTGPTTSTTIPTTVPTTVATTSATPATTAVTAPPTLPATIEPRFCVVWVEQATTLRAEPNEGSAGVGEVTIGLYWVSAVTDVRPRWYQIENGSVQGWVSNDEVDRQGECSGRGRD